MSTILQNIPVGQKVGIALATHQVVSSGLLVGIGKHGIVIDATETVGYAIFFPWHAVESIFPLEKKAP